VVEDEAITALDIQGLLESMGFEVVSIASHGVEAIQKVATAYGNPIAESYG
jgi:CheY-like chemotaxis protein